MNLKKALETFTKENEGRELFFTPKGFMDHLANALLVELEDAIVAKDTEARNRLLRDLDGMEWRVIAMLDRKFPTVIEPAKLIGKSDAVKLQARLDSSGQPQSGMTFGDVAVLCGMNYELDMRRLVNFVNSSTEYQLGLFWEHQADCKNYDLEFPVPFKNEWIVAFQEFVPDGVWEAQRRLVLDMIHELRGTRGSPGDALLSRIGKNLVAVADEEGY